jgi:hypothetical protein
LGGHALTREQLEFVELLVKVSRNIQKLAAEMNAFAYNTARSRLDEIVTAPGGAPENDGRWSVALCLTASPMKEISVEEAMRFAQKS